MTEVIFYVLPFQRESRIRMTSEAPLQGLRSITANLNIPTTYDKVASFERDVPTELSDFNFCRIGTSYFWFHADAHRANKDGVLHALFLRDPWMSANFGNAKGTFDALPTHTAPYLKANIGNDTLMGIPEMKIDIPRLPHDGARQMYWEQVTVTRSPNGIAGSGVFTFGWFIWIDRRLAPYEVEGTHTGVGDFSHPTAQESVHTVLSILKHVNTNYASSDIIDVSVSDRSPFGYTYNESTKKIDIADAGPNYYTWSSEGRTFLIYNVSTLESFHSDTVNITIPPEVRLLGSVVLRDKYNNPIGTIPVNIGNLQLHVRTVSDINGIVTQCELSGYRDHTLTDLNIRFTIQEGHLPFSSNSWQDYQALSLNYDRELMNNAIDKANADLINNSVGSLTSGIVSGALTGGGPIGAGIAALTAGIGIAGNFFSNEISKNSLEADQEAKERFMQLASSSIYNAGYGLLYLKDGIFRGAYIDFMMPANYTAELLADHVKHNGYPAVGYKTRSLYNKGYYKGYVDTFETGAIPKMLHDLLNADLMQGVRIINTIGDI